MPSDKFLSELYDLSPTEWLRLLPEYVTRRFNETDRAGAVDRILRELHKALPAEEQTALSPFSRGFMTAAEMPTEEEEILRIWFGIYPGALTLLSGETGAGKSSLLYNLAIHAARNEPLWGVPFGLGRPLRTLYIDPENSGDFDQKRVGLCYRKLGRIDQGMPELLWFHDGRGVNLSDPAHMASLLEFILANKIDLIVLDPIINLFGTKDENDNSEAGTQFAALKQLVKTTNVACIAVHHTGRNAESIFGRGATARLGMADVGMMLRVRNEAQESDDDFGNGGLHERDDAVRLQIVKNRIEPGKASIFLQMSGEDRFDRIGFAEWKAAANLPNKPKQAQDVIFAFLREKDFTPRPDIHAFVCKEMDIGERNVDAALRKMVERGELTEQRGAKNAVAYRISSITSSTGSVSQFRKPYKEDCETESTIPAEEVCISCGVRKGTHPTDAKPELRTYCKVCWEKKTQSKKINENPLPAFFNGGTA